MKRSTNLSGTRKPRNPLLDTAKFLRDLGMSPESIEAVLNEMKTGKDDTQQAEISEDANNVQ